VICLDTNDGCYVELEVGNTATNWEFARRKLNETNHQRHFATNRRLNLPNNDEDQKSYFLEGCTVDDVLELAKLLLIEGTPVQLDTSVGTNGAMRAALYYKSSEVVGRHEDGEESCVFKICLRKHPNELSWKIVSIFPGRLTKQRYRQYLV